MENEISKIACPACANISAQHQFDKGGFAFARCTECQTLFIENPPEDTSALYDEGYFFGGGSEGGYGSYDREKEAMKETFLQSLDLIETKVPNGRLFDVGAATGYFLALAQDRGWKVGGIDVSLAAAKEAKKKGIEVHAGTFDTIAIDESSQDAVTMFDVIEHVSDPGKLLNQVHQIIKAGGVVMGSTPDGGSVVAKLSGKNWHAIVPPEHLVWLNDKSLRLLFQREGYEMLWTGRITKRFTPPYILQTASRWLGLRFLNSLATFIQKTPLSRLHIPLDLRDNIFFLARKTNLL